MTLFIGFNWNKFYKIKDVQLREIDCTEKASLLEEVIISDQRVRKGSDVPFKEIVEVDHRNLETVLSILENCGMPTLEEVSSKQIGAIWITLQHAHDMKYRKKYFPFIEQAKDNGDLHKEQYALMKDRILMDEGQSQIYGTQIKGGKLYKLQNPETVNQRRKAMDMGPIEGYLKRYDIDFDVKQE